MRASPDQPANAPASALNPRLLLWRQRISQYRQPLGLIVALLLFGIALIACRHLLDELDPDALRTSLLAVPPINLFGALAMTALGFIALLGYEWSASRYAEVQLPKRILALGGFCAFAIGNAVGLAMLSGPVRQPVTGLQPAAARRRRQP